MIPLLTPILKPLDASALNDLPKFSLGDPAIPSKNTTSLFE